MGVRAFKFSIYFGLWRLDADLVCLLIRRGGRLLSVSTFEHRSHVLKEKRRPHVLAQASIECESHVRILAQRYVRCGSRVLAAKRGPRALALRRTYVGCGSQPLLEERGVGPRVLAQKRGSDENCI